MRDAERKIGELEILSGEEREQILCEWNDTERRRSGGDVRTRVVRGAGGADRKRWRWCIGEEQLSYGELNGGPIRLAHYLRKLGVGPEVVVGICLERRLEMMVGLMGVLKAGGAYVPLDPRYPAERLRYMMEDAGRGSADPAES